MTAPHILDHGNRQTWVLSFTLIELYPQRKSIGKHWTGGWVGIRAGLDTRVKGKISCPCRKSNRGLPLRSLVTKLTELSPTSGLDVVARRKTSCPYQELDTGHAVCSWVTMQNALSRLLGHLVLLTCSRMLFIHHKWNEDIMNMWVPVTTAWRAHPRVADGEDCLQIWRVAANILNKQSRRADKGWSSNFGVGRGAKNSSSWKIKLLRNVT
jgi:hypothetical protein